MPQQFTLRFDPRQHMERAHFEVGDGNRAAMTLADSWPSAYSNVTVLIGPEASGKSHLAAMIADEQHASIHKAANVDWHALAAEVAQSGRDRRLVIEDAGRGIDEAGLFHLINAVTSADAWLILTARTPPGDWQLLLPDLISRLRAATPVTIDPPEDDLLAAIIGKHLADRQTVVDPAVIRYCVARMERSYVAALDLVTRLDAVAIARKSAITRTLAADVLTEMNEPGLPGLSFDDAESPQPANESTMEKPS